MERVTAAMPALTGRLERLRHRGPDRRRVRAHGRHVQPSRTAALHHLMGRRRGRRPQHAEALAAATADRYSLGRRRGTGRTMAHRSTPTPRRVGWSQPAVAGSRPTGCAAAGARPRRVRRRGPGVLCLPYPQPAPAGHDSFKTVAAWLTPVTAVSPTVRAGGVVTRRAVRDHGFRDTWVIIGRVPRTVVRMAPTTAEVSLGRLPASAPKCGCVACQGPVDDCGGLS